MVSWDEERPSDATSWLQQSPRLLIASIVTLALLVFAVDRLLPLSLPVLYAIPILFSLWLGRRGVTISVAAMCVVLTFVAPWGSYSGDDFLIANRTAAVFGLMVVTSLGLLRLRDERELRRVRRIAITTLRNLGEAVVTINEFGVVRFVNRAAEALLDRPRGELIGRRVEDVFIARDTAPERPRVIELEQRGWQDPHEAVLFAFGGRRIPIEYTRKAIADSRQENFGEVIVFRDISNRKEHEEAMKRLAFRDELTGLHNRTSLMDRLQLELAHAKRNRERMGVVYIDLDGFKQVNDTHGHEAGDALLKHVSQRMSSTLRAGDTVARLGGDEFVLLLPAVAGIEEARRVGEKLIAAIEEPIAWRDRQLRASASIGVALFPFDGTEPETLMRRADKAMYRAKATGRGRVAIVSRLDDSQFTG